MKTFKKLVEFVKNTSLDKIKPSETYRLIIKQYTLARMASKLLKIGIMKDLFTSKTNFEFGELNDYADKIMKLLDKLELTDRLPKNQWAKMIKTASKCYWLSYTI